MVAVRPRSHPGPRPDCTGVRRCCFHAFATNDAVPSDRDKPLLDDLARVSRASHSDATITVEGFADPPGPSAYNNRLGQRRAEAGRDNRRISLVVDCAGAARTMSSMQPEGTSARLPALDKGECRRAGLR